MNNKAMFSLSYGLFVISSAKDGKKNGCITNTAIQAASDPLVLTVCINKANYTHDLVKETGKFSISVLSEEADFDLFTHFGFQSGRDTDKFADFTDYKMEGGLPVITRGTNAYFLCDVVDTVDLGSHTMFVAKIADMDVLNSVPSATYAYYHANIKPQPKKEDPPAGKVVWRCTICGYIYEGDPIPDDFICPICKHPASDFERVTQ